jgi:4-methoxybenzoate monooxygenase (O-demethylating)
MDEAKLLLQTVLSAGADTTYLTMANAMRAWALFPDQYASCAPIRNFCAMPSTNRSVGFAQPHGRPHHHDCDVVIEDLVMPAGTRCGLMFAAANRDPRYWDAPESTDIERDNKHSLGWGYGVHGCVGRTLAQTEAQALLGTIVREVAGFEIAGDYEPWMTTVGHGPIRSRCGCKFG